MHVITFCWDGVIHKDHKGLHLGFPWADILMAVRCRSNAEEEKHQYLWERCGQEEEGKRSLRTSREAVIPPCSPMPGSGNHCWLLPQCSWTWAVSRPLCLLMVDVVAAWATCIQVSCWPLSRLTGHLPLSLIKHLETKAHLLAVVRDCPCRTDQANTSLISFFH